MSSTLWERCDWFVGLGGEERGGVVKGSGEGPVGKEREES